MQNAKGLSPKHRAFVDGVIAGKSATDAYQQAYGCGRKTAEANSSRLLSTAKIAAAVEARMSKVAAKADLTLQSHLDTLNALREAASGAEQYSAAVTAEVSRGKASGFYIDKHEHKHAGKIEVRVRIEREGRRVTAS